MCVIVDVNVAHYIFVDREQRTQEGQILLDWIEEGRSIIIEEQLKNELYKNKSTKRWASQAILGGRLREYNNLNREIKKLKGKLYSNDEHIIALAQVSGARLLYTHDRKLQKDFTNKDLIAKPKGKVYPDSNPKQAKKFLENNKSICK